MKQSIRNTIFIISILVIIITNLTHTNITGAATIQQCSLEHAGEKCCYLPTSSESEVKTLLEELYDKYPNNFPKHIGSKEDTIGLVMALIYAETSPKSRCYADYRGYKGSREG